METSHDPLVSPRPFRFNIKAMLILTAVVGLVIAPAQWLGGVYLVSAAFSAGLVICCVLAYRHAQPAAAFGVAVAGAFLGFLLAIFMVVFLFHAFLNAVLCLLLLVFQPRPRVFAALLCSLAVGVYAFVLYHAAESYRELAAMRADYPLVSLAERLAFESASPVAGEASDKPLPLTSAVAANLDALDERQETRYFERAWSLEELHENSYEHFARAAGFGFARMPSLHRGYVELDPREELALPQPLANLSSDAPASQLNSMHREATYDFVDRDRMGYVRSREAVAGFDSHGLSAAALPSNCPKKQRTKWQITRLELVGLLRHDEPVVYVAESMPTMDQLADVPTRPLNDFEKAALSKLATQEDIVVDQQPERIRMLGAVRAGKTCLECHDGPRGKLLGAFSYEIVPLVGSSQATSKLEGRVSPDS